MIKTKKNRREVFMFQNKVVVITGGASGIGKCIAEEFRKAGAAVCVIDKAEGEHYVGDISRKEVLEAFAEEVIAKYGQVDILVNNAGVSESTPFTEYTEETFDKVMDLNVKGVFNATRAAVECMVPRGSGVILSTSSMVSISGQPSGFAYPASKFAVNGLTVSLARELGPKGIRVNAVAPGITETDMMKAVPKEVIEPMIARIPLRRLGQPEDIARAVVALCDGTFGYTTGQSFILDGGMHIRKL